jgi:ribosome-binding factor A
MSRRTEMLGSTIQREIAEMIMRDLDDPRLPTIVSVTRVKVSEDLEYADVFVSVMGTPGQQTAALNALKHAAGAMRTKLTKSLSIRVAPFLRFQFDEQLKKEMAVLELLEQVRRENEELERKRAEAGEAAGEPAREPGDGGKTTE